MATIEDYLEHREIRIRKVREEIERQYALQLDERIGIKRKRDEFERIQRKLESSLGMLYSCKDCNGIHTVTEENISEGKRKLQEDYLHELKTEREKTEALHGEGIKQGIEKKVSSQLVRDNLEELFAIPKTDNVRLYQLCAEEVSRVFEIPSLPTLQEGETPQNYAASVQRTIDTLKSKRLITNGNKKAMETLFVQPVRANITTSNTEVREYVLVDDKDIGELVEAEADDDDPQFKREFLAEMYGISGERQERYLGLSLTEIDNLHHRLYEAFNHDNSLVPQVVSLNPDLLLYARENRLAKYLATISLVRRELEVDTPNKDLSKKFGLETDLTPYSSLDGILKLRQGLKEKKEKLFPRAEAQPEVKDAFDLDEYRNELLEKAGLYAPVARAIIEGNKDFVGETYIPEEYFRKNTHGRATQRDISLHYNDTFEALFQASVLTRKRKSNRVFRINPHLDLVENPLLREYLRVTIYEDQILAQEGAITPQIVL